MCTATECTVEYTRGKLNVQNNYDVIKKRVPSFDRTVDNNSKYLYGNIGSILSNYLIGTNNIFTTFQIKFFTKYGMCRVRKHKMPKLPAHVSKSEILFLSIHTNYLLHVYELLKYFILTLFEGNIIQILCRQCRRCGSSGWSCFDLWWRNSGKNKR